MSLSGKSLLFRKVLLLVHDVVDANREHCNSVSVLTPFTLQNEPSLDISSFMRMVSNSKVAGELEWIQAVVLVNRLISKVGETLNIYNSQKLIIAALCISVKLERDIPNLLSIISKYSDLSIEELSRLERTFLRALEWDLVVSAEEVEAALHTIDEGVGSRVSPLPVG